MVSIDPAALPFPEAKSLANVRAMPITIAAAPYRPAEPSGCWQSLERAPVIEPTTTLSNLLVPLGGVSILRKGASKEASCFYEIC